MLHNARTWIALAVIAGGITAAVVFPKEKVKMPPPDRGQADGLVRREFDFEEAIARTPSTTPATLDAPTAPVVEVPITPGLSPLDMKSPPPRLEDTYPAHAPVAGHRLSPKVFRELAQPPVGATSTDNGGSSPLAKRLTHKIVDGDTLHTLAQRYLGNADRYLELFQENRDRLPSPEVLPIGIELRIPVGEPPATSAPRVNASPVSMGQVALQPTTPSAAFERGVAPMVEIPPGSLRSIAANSDQAAGTYRVQEGDTLVSIARKLYGGGRRYRDIFEANRDQLTSPNALPVGVLLKIP